MRLLQTLAALGATVALMAPMAAHAFVSHEVQPGANQMTVLKADQKVLFELNNPSPQPMKFSFPEVGVTYDVPATSQSTFFFDGKQMPKREIGFKVMSLDGKAYGEGKIINDFAYTNTTPLSQIINFNSQYTFDKKPEPRYYR